MAIKRLSKPIVEIPDYSAFRLHMWELQGHIGYFNPHRSMYVIDGEDVPIKIGDVVLVPKPNFYFKDVWHCGCNHRARELLSAIALFKDLVFVEMHHKWIKVEWNHSGKEWRLPEQPIDDRDKVRG